MFKKLTINLLSLLLTGLIGAVFFAWVFELVDIKTPGLTPVAVKEYPEWYWEGADYRSYTEAGLVAQEATAKDALHYKNQDKTLLSEPSVTTYADNRDTWFTDARQGSIAEDGNRLELWDDVHIRKDDDSLSVRTERLVVFPEQNMAETDKPVILTGKGTRTDAVGMRAWLETQKIELLSEVKTVHDPR